MLPIILAINDEKDRSFVENLYEQYGKKIYKVAFQILKNEMDAEDCLHDVIKTIIDNLDKFKAADHEHLIHLLVKCARNLAINQYNREKKRRSMETDMHMQPDAYDFDEETEIEIADSAQPFDDILINEENKKRITELIGELPIIYQDVLYFKYQMWMGNAEIAKLLHLSENAVKVRLYRAKKILLETRGAELRELRKNG